MYPNSIQTPGAMYLYRECFKANVYTIWVHGPSGDVATCSDTGTGQPAAAVLDRRSFRSPDPEARPCRLVDTVAACLHLSLQSTRRAMAAEDGSPGAGILQGSVILCGVLMLYLT